MKSRYYPDEAKRFAADTTKHAMTILHDDGLYRHIRFKKPGTFAYFFDLITWPGCLTIRGDMGSYTWARIEDMLDFFLSGPDINPGYWAEKVQGAPAGVRAHSAEQVRRHVHDEWREYAKGNFGAPHLPEVRAELAADVLAVADYEPDARSALRDFRSHGLQFNDAWEWDLQDFTWQYLWCCFAVRWGAEQYVASRVVAA